MRYLILLLALAGCHGAATGPTFSEAPKHSVVVYQNDNSTTIFGNQKNYTIPLSYEGKECTLHNKSFVLIEPSEAITIRGSLPLMPGKSEITVGRPKGVEYIRAEYDKDKQQAGLMFGYVGSAIAEGTSNSNGPFLFQKVTESQGKADLTGLHQDCM